MSDTAPTLADLLAEADSAGHDHAATEKNSGLRHIHNHATGAIVWFPTWQKFRETSDWREAVDDYRRGSQGWFTVGGKSGGPIRWPESWSHS